MNRTAIVTSIVSRLREANYLHVPTPLTLAGVNFNFTAVLRGQHGRGLDLVVIDVVPEQPTSAPSGKELTLKIETLSRALDITNSRFVITLIAVGELSQEDSRQLSDACRLLCIGQEFETGTEALPDDFVARLEDRIRILLPLELPMIWPDSSGDQAAMDQLASRLGPGANTAVVEALISAAAQGDEAVTEAVSRAINDALSREDQV